jgi:homoserine dehydrogenase
MRTELNIGLFGFGCVGQGLYDVLKSSRGIRADINRFVVKNRHKVRPLKAELFQYDPGVILDDPEINLVVELIDNAEEAYDLVTKALKNGKSVVSANKKMLALNLEELVHLQKETGQGLLYEASSCGSIPIIRTLEEYYDNETLFSVEGVFNGSSNYILTKVFEEGVGYDTALKEAQDMGFAETDPTLDVEGFDAKYKLIIIAAHSFGLFIHPDQVLNIGISKLNINDINYAKEKRLKIRQVAHVGRINDDEVTMYVMPKMVPESDYLYEVMYEYNAVCVKAAFSDVQFFRGKGAGGHPTGSAVLSDISATTYNYRYEYKKHNSGFVPSYSTQVKLKVYCRFNDRETYDHTAFVKVSQRFEGEHYNYVIAEVSLDVLKDHSFFKRSDVFVAGL